MGKENINKRAETMSREMKHSGIEWIGEVPEHWGVKRLKEIFVLHEGL